MRFKAKFTATDQRVDVSFAATDQDFTPEIVAFTRVVPQYQGPYDVTPQVEAQTLHTNQRMMTDDVTVQGVPVYRVSNPAGGTTVYIAREV